MTGRKTIMGKSVFCLIGFALIAIIIAPSVLFAVPLDAVEGQSWDSSGHLNIIWGDGRDGETQTIYALTEESGQETLLLIDESLSQSLGGVLWFNHKKVSVTGVWATTASIPGAVTGLKVSSMSLAQSPAKGAMIDYFSTAVTGSRPWITIMCKFSDIAAEPENLAFFSGMYANSKPGLDHYWRELSYDTANVAGSSASGWFVLPHPKSYYNPTNTQGGANLDLLRTDCIAAADASVNFASYSGINMMFNTDFDNGYAWGGSRYMTLDGVSKTWSVTWEPPWAYADISVIQHEMGHGFGLPHSSGAYGATYDNAWDVMSKDRYNCAAATDPTYGCIAQHTISYHKDLLGWIPDAQKTTVATGNSSTITLEQLALPATTNYLMAKIPIGGSTTHFYTVEVRRLTGYDIKVAGAAVIIHEVDTTRQRPANVIDADLNGVTSDAGAMWDVGETFVDSTNNISVRVDSATATGFQVTIGNQTVSLTAPVLTGEPAETRGRENTIFWSAVSSPAASRTVPDNISHITADALITPAQATLHRGSRIFLPPDQGDEVLSVSDSLAVTTVFSETFEGAFPGSTWTLYGTPTWGGTSFDSHGGSMSGWCAGSAASPSTGYSDNMNAWAVYGPFDLSDATDADLDFWYRNYSETGSDYFKWMASVNGSNFSGYQVSGDQNTWGSQNFDLTNVPSLGNLAGQSQVWIAFIFSSNASVSGPGYTGAFIDDVVITKDATVIPPDPMEYYAECADNSGFASPVSSGWITETQWTFTSLRPGKTYWYRVKARSGTHESDWSNVEYSRQKGISLPWLPLLN